MLQVPARCRLKSTEPLGKVMISRTLYDILSLGKRQSQERYGRLSNLYPLRRPAAKGMWETFVSRYGPAAWAYSQTGLAVPVKNGFPQGTVGRTLARARFSSRHLNVAGLQTEFSMSESVKCIASLLRRSFQECGIDINHIAGEYDFSLISSQ
jgi:hypothetical protein